MSNVFISYSRKDSEAVQRIHDALIEKGKNPWIDSEMPKSVDFLDEIYQAIESSDCFLVAISPDSASSEVCDLELKRALLHRKRIIPVVLSDVPARELPHEVSQLNWIFLRDDSDFAAGIDEIVKAIDTNPVWARTHTRLLTRAVLWEKNGNDRSRLLRGGDLIEAERQLGLVREEDSPRPTALQRQFMAASRKAYSQFWRTVLMCVSTALVAVVGLAIYSWFLKGQAEDQADRYARSTFSLQLGRVQGEVEERKYAEALKLLGDADRCPEHLRSFMWSYYLDQCQRQRALLSGHGAAVNCLSLSPDGKQIASSSDDHTIRLWKVSDWNSTVTLKGHQDEIWAVSFVPTQTSRQASKQIVSGSRDGVVLLWDLDQPDKPRQISHHNGENTAVTAVCFSPNADRLAVAHEDGLLRLLDSTSWQVIDDQKVAKKIPGLSWASDGSTIAAACEDEKVHLWNANLSGHRNFTAHAGGTRAVCFLNNPQQLVTAGEDGKVRVWPGSLADVIGSDVKWESEIGVDGRGVCLTAFDDERRFACGTSSGAVYVWQRGTAKREVTLEIQFHVELARSAKPIDKSIYSLCILKKGSQLLAAGHDGSIRLWQVHDLFSTVYQPPLDLSAKAIQIDSTGRLAAITTSSFDFETSSIVNGEAFWKRLDQNEPLRALTPASVSTEQDRKAFQVVVSPDGTFIVPLFAGASSVAVHQPGKTPAIIDVAGHTSPVMTARFSADSRLLTTVDASGRVLLHETEGWNTRASFEAGKTVYLPAFSGDGSRLGLSLEKGSIEILNTSDLTLETQLNPPDGVESIADLLFDDARDRLLVVAGNSVYSASLADSQLKMLLPMAGHGEATCISCSPDGQLLATGHADGVVRMWDALTNDLRGQIPGQLDAQGKPISIASLFFHPDRRRLFVIDNRPEVRAYDAIEPANWTSLAPSR